MPDAAGGLTLTLTPHILADGIVHLSVSPTFTGLPGDVEGDFTRGCAVATRW